MNRQKMEVMLPVLKVKAEMDPMGWPGGMRQQLKVATPLAECVLRGLKAQSGLEGVLRPKFLDNVDAVGKLLLQHSFSQCAVGIVFML